jgi:hypothetical protein
MRQAADSASADAATRPPPAWLDRIAPGASTRYSMQKSNSPRVFNAFAAIWGVGLGVGFLGGALGTVGWIGTMLVIFYASGHWLRAAPSVAIESDTA